MNALSRWLSGVRVRRRLYRECRGLRQLARDEERWAERIVEAAMTYARKRDGNHADIVLALRQIGATVLDLASLGRDCPDLAVYYRGDVWMLEVKNPKGWNRVSAGQRRWLEAWPGPSGIVRSAEEAINLIARAA